jgi:hypothetical protein
VTITINAIGNCPKSVSDSIKVSVLPVPIPPIIDSMHVSGSHTLVIITANGTYTNYQWVNNSSGNIAGASFNKYTPTVTGSYSLVVTGSNGCKSTSNTKSITIDGSNGINSFTVDNHIIAYPNPFEGQVSFGFDMLKAEAISIEIVDITGRVVYKTPNMQYERGIGTYIFDGNELSAGVYIARVKAGKEVKTFKLSKN